MGPYVFVMAQVSSVDVIGSFFGVTSLKTPEILHMETRIALGYRSNDHLGRLNKADPRL